MRARLMFADRERRGEREQRVGEDDLIADLELETVWAAMAQGDPVIHESARSAMLDGLTDLEQIRYRQAVLADCLRRPDVIREIYALAVSAVADEKQVYRGFFNTQGEARIRRSVAVLELFDERLRRLRAIADRDGADFGSVGFKRFFDTVRRELDDDYFREVGDHVRRLGFDGGVLATARLGKHGQGVEYVLHEPPANPAARAAGSGRSDDPRSAARSRHATRPARGRSARCATGCSRPSPTPIGRVHRSHHPVLHRAARRARLLRGLPEPARPAHRQGRAARDTGATPARQPDPQRPRAV